MKIKIIIIVISLIYLLTGCISLNVPDTYLRVINKLKENTIYYTIEGTKYENKEGTIPVDNRVDMKRVDYNGKFILKIYSDKTKERLLYSCENDAELEYIEDEEVRFFLFEMTEDKIIK